MAESLLLLVEEFKHLDRKRKLGGKLTFEEAQRLDKLRLVLAQKLQGGGNADRRQELRVPTTLRVKYRTGETFINNYINNLSSGGVFISTPKPLPLDTVIKLHLVFEDDNKEIAVEGKVVWESTQKSPFHDTTKAGMGVKFTKITTEAQEAIDNLIHGALTEHAMAEEEESRKEKPKGKKSK